VLKQVVKANPDVRLVYKHYALPNHPRARPAAIASVAAQRQGKFWEMHDLLFQNQRTLDDASIRRHAESISLDMEAFDRDLNDPEIANFVDEEGLQARRAGVTGTPNVFVNGVKSPTWDQKTLQRLIQTARAGGDVGNEAGQVLADLNKRRQARSQRRQQDFNKIYNINVDGAAFKGPEDAQIVIVAFSDYQ
jgi:protein-disulfide isomerase